MSVTEPTPQEVALIAAVNRLVEAQRAYDEAELELEAARDAYRRTKKLVA